jgi:hypothetical protein
VRGHQCCSCKDLEADFYLERVVNPFVEKACRFSGGCVEFQSDGEKMISCSSRF